MSTNVSHIKTDKSFLNVYSFEKYGELIEKSIDEVKDELLVNPPIYIYGKKVHQQRSIGFFSDESIGYYYSRQLARAKHIQPNSLKLMQLINEQFGTKYNGILVNKYENGNNYISAHSDDEKNLDKGGVIAISEISCTKIWQHFAVGVHIRLQKSNCKSRNREK